MIMRPYHFALALALSGLIALGAQASWAAGTPSGGSSGSGKCSQYTKGSPAWKKCIKGGRTEMNDEDLYSAGYYLAKAGDYEEALSFLGAIKNQSDVRVLTMTGYSTRKLGKIDEGMAYYMKALSIDPNSVTTREYLGEAYLQKKDLPDAKAQLIEIQNRCGTTCESFTELDDQISKYESSL
jgi:tetratricopeptide (TPR) repeat protein